MLGARTLHVVPAETALRRIEQTARRLDAQPIPEGTDKAILVALERHQVLYVVIGGAAAQARGWPEPTDDIDVTPERFEGNLSLPL
jgi:hypothetical protein